MSSLQFVVLGASGGCGREVVRHAASRGHVVRAVVRQSSDYEAPKTVEVLRGDITDPDFFRSAMTDHPIVLSCIGQRRDSVFPWSKRRSPADLVTQIATLLATCGDLVERAIWISAGGVGSSLADSGPLIRQMITFGNVGVAYADLNAAEKIIAGSSINALAVRPVTLTHGEAKRKAQAVRRYAITSTVRRSEVAEWMVDIADGTLVYDRPDVLLG